jgi:phosphoglycolate phosphatase-like HAD superfamily hydrolase
VTGVTNSPVSQEDPLPSWNDGAAKAAILRFVRATTDPAGPSHVPPAERIAVFDNDGTLWSEQPFYFQFAFAFDQLRAMAPEHPEWLETEPFKSVLAGDIPGVFAGGMPAILEIAMATHAGMTVDEFDILAREWLATARHPKTDKPFTAMVFQPMLELLAYLRANAFKTFIVSGGGIEFMRAFAEATYGVPPEQVIGSSGKLKFEMRGDEPVLTKLLEIQVIDDNVEKPAVIQNHIGRRPIASFGNSDGDLAMLQWTTAGRGPRFAMIVHHTDEAREWAYDRDAGIGTLDKALDEAKAKGWTVVDMKYDWRRIYPFE